jgi:hypothetical protein
MRKIFRNISVLFIWLAWLVITAHLIIPHDHHSADSFATNQNSCATSHGKEDHHPGFPIHCHAFNDLASEKARPYIIKNVQNSVIGFCSFSYSSVFESNFPWIKITDFQKFLPDSYLLAFTPLRAPPLSC